MFLFFHDIGISSGALLVGFFIIILPIVVISIRGIWIIATGKSRRATLYSGGIFFSSIILWLLCWFSGSQFLEVFLMLLTLPFGMILGFLHGDIGFYLIRDAILGNLNSAHHPVTLHVYLYEAFINALAVANAVQIIERKIKKRNLKLR